MPLAAVRRVVARLPGHRLRRHNVVVAPGFAADAAAARWRASGLTERADGRPGDRGRRRGARVGTAARGRRGGRAGLAPRRRCARSRRGCSALLAIGGCVLAARRAAARQIRRPERAATSTSARSSSCCWRSSSRAASGCRRPRPRSRPRGGLAIVVEPGRPPRGRRALPPRAGAGARADLGALELARPAVPADYVATRFPGYPSSRSDAEPLLRRRAARYGSPAYTAAEIAAAPSRRGWPPTPSSPTSTGWRCGRARRDDGRDRPRSTRHRRHGARPRRRACASGRRRRGPAGTTRRAAAHRPARRAAADRGERRRRRSPCGGSPPRFPRSRWPAAPAARRDAADRARDRATQPWHVRSNPRRASPHAGSGPDADAAARCRGRRGLPARRPDGARVLLRRLLRRAAADRGDRRVGAGARARRAPGRRRCRAAARAGWRSAGSSR